MKLLILNATANTGSTGRIAEDIGFLAQQSGFEVRFAYGRREVNSSLQLMRIGSEWDTSIHGVKSRLFDAHGFGSRNATKAFIRDLEVWKPDLINIHNLHGYYINVEILFEYLKRLQIPVVWTFHDCWPFTGHCAHFERVGCYKWQTECHHCPLRSGYPASWFFDNSTSNFRRKKEIFNGLNNLTIVTPSQWLAEHVSNSFLGSYAVKMINNGVNLNIFKPKSGIETTKSKYGISSNPVVLGVANTWKKRKALEDFVCLNQLLAADIQIVLVGMTQEQAKGLPSNIIPIARTENVAELAALYSAADVFVNPTYVDNFPTTNIEALACGTPIITYHTGGSPEAIDEQTGIVVPKGDINGLANAVNLVMGKGKAYYSQNCRNRAEKLYNKDARFRDYLDLFQKMITP